MKSSKTNKPTRYYLRVNLVIIMTIIYSYSYSQDVPSTIVPPSPTAASLGKFGDIPVGTYTGIPNISIPIWEVSDGNIKVPITLNYHSSGLKVEEVPSWVGTGWALNAGGVITRSVRGYPDESEYGYVNGAGGSGHGEFVEKYIKEQLNDPTNFKVAVANGQFDTQPDVFYYNFLGHTGSFVLDKNGVPLLFPMNDLKVSGNMATGFIIKTPQGFEIKFDVMEVTEVYPKNFSNYWEGITLSDDYRFTSSWYISEIVSAAGGKVIFSYDDELISHESIGAILLRRPLEGSDSRCGDLDNYSWNKTFIEKKRLKQISSTTSYVQFAGTTLRNDLAGAHRLDGITIKSKGELIKSFNLDYDYLGTTSCPRLILNSVTEFSSTDEASNPYLFEYNQLDPPCFDSKKQDYWGYYNNNSSSTLIPPVDNEYSDLSILYALPHNMNYQADRSPDEAKTKAGILKRIIYPTGGYTLFEYELNDYGFINTTKVDGVLLGDYQLIAQAEVFWNPENPESTFSEANFSIGAKQEIKIYWSIWPTNEPSTSTVLIEDSPATLVAIYNESGSLVFRRNLQTFVTIQPHKG